MVIAAHPDDEALMAAGVIRRAVLNGDQVNVVIFNNGEGSVGVSQGFLRQGESVAAMGVIGLNENNVIFLGYADGLLGPMFRAPDLALSSAYGTTATYGNRGLGRSDYHFYAFGSHGTYKGQTVLQDLKSLFETFAPDEIYTHHYYDGHEDHKYANQFVIKAILEMRRQGAYYAPVVFENVVHDQSTATCLSKWPGLASQTFTQPECLYSTSPNPPYRWSDITSIDVPADMQSSDPALNLKHQAFNQYRSQLAAWWSYTKKNEWFWRREIGRNLAPLAQVTVSSETFRQYGVNAVDGTLSGEPHDLTKEWRAGTPNVGEWIKLTWPIPQTITQIILYDRPNLSDNILSGTLLFSDGSTIAVGALPTNGAGQVISFASKTVSWVMLTVNSRNGYYTGLAEFEVYGAASTLPANRSPQIVSGPTATPATINSTQSSQISVTATDPDADSLTYSWNSTGGTLTGNGTTVTFQSPAVNSQTVYTITVTVSDGRGGTVQGSTTVTVAPTNLSTSNLASLATVQVSTENINSGQLGVRAVDGIVDGYPNDRQKEWATVGQTEGAWIQLSWTVPQSVSKVVLYDRPNEIDNILAGTLSFSDGSAIPVGALPTTGGGLTLLFTERVVSWVRFTINSAQGANTGLAEFEVFGAAGQPTLPVVTVTASTPSASENGVVGQFAINRSGSTATALTVNYTVGGTATPGQDYTALTGSINIPVNASSVTVAVAPIDDNLVEGNETVVVTLSTNAAYTLGSPASATVTVADNDVAAGPSLVASPAGVNPGAAVTAGWSGLTNPTGKDWIGVFAVGAGDGGYQNWVYVNCARTPGAAFASGSCALATPTANGNYELRLFANDGFSRLATSNQFSINNNLAAVSVTASVANVVEGGAAGQFVVTRSGGIASPLTVFYSLGGTATNGTDYQTLSGIVVIPQNALSATIAVIPIVDSLVESSETVILTLSADGGYTVGAPRTATITVVDNNFVPTVSITGGTFAYDGLPHGAIGFAYGNGGVNDVLSPAVTFTYQGSSGTVYGPTSAAAINVGSYQATASFAGNANYSSASGTVALTITSANAPLVTMSPANPVQGSVVTVSWNSIVNAKPMDWMGLYRTGAADQSYLSWLYVSCAQTPGVARASGSCLYELPNIAGSFEIRLFSNDGFSRIAVSNPITAGPNIILGFDGLIRDRVGQANRAPNPDALLDGVFNVVLGDGSGSRTLTRLYLTNTLGGIWNTENDIYWTLGVAGGLDSQLLNSVNDTVNLALTAGSTVKVFAADFQNSMYLPGTTFTLTATFSDGATASASVTIP